MAHNALQVWAELETVTFLIILFMNDLLSYRMLNVKLLTLAFPAHGLYAPSPLGRRPRCIRSKLHNRFFPIGSETALQTQSNQLLSAVGHTDNLFLFCDT